MPAGLGSHCSGCVRNVSTVLALVLVGRRSGLSQHAELLSSAEASAVRFQAVGQVSTECYRWL